MGGFGEDTYGEGPYGIGEDYVPFVENETLDGFPDIMPRDGSIFSKYVKAHDERLMVFDSDITMVIASHQISNATGADLDKIGQLFGQLGRRRNRDDTDYRNYLSSIVDSFSGRGTKSGIRFALAGGVSTTSNNIDIIEHTQDLENSIVVSDWNAHNNSTIVTLFNLSKPSVVQLRYPIEYEAGSGNVEVSGSTRAGNSDAGLGSGTIGDNQIGFYE